jgi:hypothetical protein
MKSVKEQTLSNQQIRTILKNSKLDYETTVNKALNAYLSQIFLTCPFTNQLCLTEKQCLGCKSAKILV